MFKLMPRGWSLAFVFMILSFFLSIQTKQTQSKVQNLQIPITTEINDQKLKLQACLLPLEGSGVIIIMDDSTKQTKSGENPNLYLIHDDDILKVINELRAAGAEAISINGQRLIDRSEIRCAGPTLSVNNVRSSAPFEIHAIGEVNTLKNAINMRGGIAETLKVWGINLEVKMSDSVYIPPYKGDYHHIYAEIVPER